MMMIMTTMMLGYVSSPLQNVGAANDQCQQDPLRLLTVLRVVRGSHFHDPTRPDPRVDPTHGQL